MTRLLPIEQNTDLVTYKIEIGGEAIPMSIPIYSIEIINEINRVPTACIYIADGDASLGEWPVSSGDFFIPGNEISIFAGYHSEDEQVFSGIVISQCLRVRKGRLELQVTCKDKTVALTTTKKSRHFVDVTDADAAAEILAEYEISDDIASTEVTHTDLACYDTTDWDFIISRLEANGLVCMADADGFRAFVPEVSDTGIATLQFGANIISLDAEIDARTQCGAVTARAWDHAAQEIAESEGEDPGWSTVGDLDPAVLADSVGAATDVLRHGGGLSTDELQQWANGRLLRSRMAMLRGRACVQGLSAVTPGSTVELAGLGDRFNGLAWVGGVRHEIGNGQWLTDIEFGMPKEWHSERIDGSVSSAETLIEAVPGLHTGVVTGLEGDPAGEARIRVKIPSLDFEGEGVWARIATLDAGDGRGTFFRPEIDDEVILGFLNDDPRHPVVLGMVHSSALPPPEEATDDNHIKGYYSRTGMRILFDDETTQLTVDTPGGHSILLDDDGGEVTFSDSNDNIIKMSSSGITIESAGDLILKGGGNVTIEASTNVEMKASAQWKAEGSAGAEINSSGVTVIKGSLVQIN